MTPEPALRVVSTVPTWAAASGFGALTATGLGTVPFCAAWMAASLASMQASEPSVVTM